MKIATYNKLGGGTFTVEYDPKLPCVCCGLPVENASMGGTRVCPACDCGYKRSEKCPPYAKEMPKINLEDILEQIK